MTIHLHARGGTLGAHALGPPGILSNGAGAMAGGAGGALATMFGPLKLGGGTDASSGLLRVVD